MTCSAGAATMVPLHRTLGCRPHCPPKHALLGLLALRYTSYTSRKKSLLTSSLLPSWSSRNLMCAAVQKADTWEYTTESQNIHCMRRLFSCTCRQRSGYFSLAARHATQAQRAGLAVVCSRLLSTAPHAAESHRQLGAVHVVPSRHSTLMAQSTCMLLNLCRASCSWLCFLAAELCFDEGHPGESAPTSWGWTHLQIVELVHHSQVHGACDPHLLVHCIKCSVQDELVEVLSTILQEWRLSLVWEHASCMWYFAHGAIKSAVGVTCISKLTPSLPSALLRSASNMG